MANIKKINLSQPNDKKGTPLRDGGQIINDNFEALDKEIAKTIKNKGNQKITNGALIVESTYPKIGVYSTLANRMLILAITSTGDVWIRNIHEDEGEFRSVLQKKSGTIAYLSDIPPQARSFLAEPVEIDQPNTRGKRSTSTPKLTVEQIKNNKHILLERCRELLVDFSHLPNLTEQEQEQQTAIKAVFSILKRLDDTTITQETELPMHELLFDDKWVTEQPEPELEPEPEPEHEVSDAN